MTVILRLSQSSYDWTLRVSRGCKSSLWLRRVKQHSKHDYKSQGNSDWHQSPSSQALTLMIHTYQHGCMTCHTSAIFFTCDNRFFACWYWLNRNFFPHWGFFSTSHLSLQSLGQVTKAKYLQPGVVYISSNSIYFKYLQNTSLLSKRRSTWEISKYVFFLRKHIQKCVVSQKLISKRICYFSPLLMLWNAASFLAVEISS